MSRSIHWFIPFVSADGTPYRINIYDENWSQSPVQLNGATDPIVTEDTDTDDIFEPVISSTGYIKIIDTDGSIADGVRATNHTDRYVELIRTDYNITEWRGYIKPEEYSGSLEPSPKEIDLPIVSLLCVLKDITYTIDNNEVTIGSIITKVLNLTSASWSNVEISSNISTGILSATLVDNIFEHKGSEDKKYYYGKNPDVEEPTDKYSAFDVLSEICMLCGWTAIETGDRISLLSKDSSTSYYNYTWSNFSSGNYSSYIPGNRSTINVSWLSGHEYNVISPKCQIRLSVKTPQYDEPIISISDISTLQYEQDRDTRYTSNTNRAVWCGTLYSDSDYIITKQWRGSSAPTTSVVNHQIVAENINATSQTGVSVLGGVICRDAYTWTDGDNPKKSASITVSCCPIDGYYGTFYKAVSLRSSKVYKFSNMYLDLRYKYERIGFDYENDPKPEEDTTAHNALYIKVKWLRIGESSPLYLDPSSTDTPFGAWTTTDKRVLLDRTSIRKFTTSMLGVAEGIVMPPPPGAGRMEIEIQIFSNFNESNPTKYVKFSQFDVVPLLDYNDNKDKDEMRYVEVLDNTIGEVYERDQSLSIENYSKNCNGHVYLQEGDQLNAHTALLARMKAWYNRQHKVIDAKLRRTRLLPTLDINVGDEEYIVIGSKTNWRDAQKTVRMISK